MADKPSFQLRVGFGTHAGKVRKSNEDALLADAKRALFIVADGMGGHQAGEVASRFAVETLSARLPLIFDVDEAARIRPILQDVVKAAHAEILRSAGLMDDLEGMGTTVVLAQVVDSLVYVANVGDSRAYLSRRGVLKQLTEDHSVAARMVREGELDSEEARRHPMHPVLYNVLGQTGQDPDIDVASYEHHAGDALLLCSDGLTDLVEDDAIAEILSCSQSPQKICDRLIEIANGNGGRDNITAIVVRFDAV